MIRCRVRHSLLSPCSLPPLGCFLRPGPSESHPSKGASLGAQFARLVPGSSQVGTHSTAINATAWRTTKREALWNNLQRKPMDDRHLNRRHLARHLGSASPRAPPRYFWSSPGALRRPATGSRFRGTAAVGFVQLPKG